MEKQRKDKSFLSKLWNVCNKSNTIKILINNLFVFKPPNPSSM